MRYLHHVQRHETLAARGTYIHLTADGHPTGHETHWSLHHHPDGAGFWRCDDDSRAQDGLSVLSEAWQSPPDNNGYSGRIERLDLQAFGGVAQGLHTLRTTFMVYEDHVETGVSLDDAARTYTETPLDRDVLLLPPGLAYAAYMVAQHSAAGLIRGLRPVLYVVDTRLTVMLEPVQGVLHHQADEVLSLDGIEYAARRLAVSGALLGQPDTEVTLWVDAHHVPLRLLSSQAHWRLTRYTRLH